MTWKQDARRILTMLLGLVLTAAGFFFMYLEMKGGATHPTHIYVFSGFIAVGCLILAPATMMSAFKQVAGLLPSVTIDRRVGAGRRDEDEKG